MHTPYRFQGLATVAVALVWALLLTLSPGVRGDQSDPALSDLYRQLLNAPDGATAASLESRIWQVWLKAPDERSQALLQSVSQSMDLRNYEEALSLSSELVELYPAYAEAWNKRATVYYLMSDFDASVSDILETLKREPRHFGAISGLGLIFSRSGKLDEALGAFEQVLEISPRSANAQRSVQQLRQELGKGI